MHLKIQLLSRGLKLSNFKPGCRVSGLHFSVKEIPPMAFWHRARSDKCFFSASYSKINPSFTAGGQIGVRNCHATRGHRITTIFTYIAYGYNVFFRVVESKEDFCSLTSRSATSRNSSKTKLKKCRFNKLSFGVFTLLVTSSLDERSVTISSKKILKVFFAVQRQAWPVPARFLENDEYLEKRGGKGELIWDKGEKISAPGFVPSIKVEKRSSTCWHFGSSLVMSKQNGTYWISGLPSTFTFSSNLQNTRTKLSANRDRDSRSGEKRLWLYGRWELARGRRDRRVLTHEAEVRGRDQGWYAFQVLLEYL